MLVLTEPMRAVRRAAAVRGAERLGERAHLDRIAQRRAGAVRLDVADRRPAPRRRRASASAITPAWPSTLGAVKPTFSAPSLLIAEPLITAWMVSPSASASAAA